VISTSKLLRISVLLSLFLFPVFTLKVGASNEDMAASAISRAEETMASAYETVLEAEQARANVSKLLDRLNVAGEHLDEAHMFYRLGNFDGAIHSADLSSEIGADVKNEAEELTVEAYGSWIRSVWIRIIGSIVGVIFVVFGAFIVWRVFKRRYIRQIQR
jgi:hypothetical protein